LVSPLTSPEYRVDGPDEYRPFDAAALECDLRALWKREAQSAGAVYRAALSNLVVAIEPGTEEAIAPILVDVTRQHPSRLFSITGGSAGEDSLRARVGALCHAREGGGGLVCCEHVMLRAGERSSGLVPSAVRSLLIGDLPTVLLDLTQDCGTPWVNELLESSDVVLEDTRLRASREDIVTCWSRLERQGSIRVHDLAWARLNPWREIVAEIFDRPEHLPSLGSLDRVEIEYAGGSFPPSSAWLLIGWLATRLRWKPEIRSALKRGRPLDPGRIERVRLQARAPHPLDVEIHHPPLSPTAELIVRNPRASRTEVAFAYREFASCITAEIHRHEPNRSLEAAARMAQELMKSWYGA